NIFAECFEGDVGLVALAAMEGPCIAAAFGRFASGGDHQIADQMLAGAAAAELPADALDHGVTTLDREETGKLHADIGGKHGLVHRPVTLVAGGAETAQHQMDFTFDQKQFAAHDVATASNSGSDFSTAAAAVLAASRAKAWKSSWLSSPARSDSARMISQGAPNASAT